MNYIKWPQDWNRPLSEEELAIAKRLKLAPDDGEGTFERMGEVGEDQHPRLSGECASCSARERRGKNDDGGIKRAWMDGQPEFIEGDG